MQCIPIHTRILRPPKDDLIAVFDESLPEIKNRDVIIVTSKVVSIHQGKCVRRDGHDKVAMAKSQSQSFLPNSSPLITIIQHALVLAAGIDPFDGHYVSLPDNPNEFAEEIKVYLCKKYKLTELGVIISDSHSAPFRRGVMCYAIGYAGIKPLMDQSDRGDNAQWTTNILDVLTGFGGLYLGESVQKHTYTPIVIMRDFKYVEFTDKRYDDVYYLKKEDDLYAPLYAKFIDANKV